MKVGSKFSINGKYTEFPKEQFLSLYDESIVYVILTVSIQEDRVE